MRSWCVIVLTLLALGTGAPAWAQLVTNVAPEMVVARLLSFDRNADGRIVVEELPERLRGLLARGDHSHDGALDATEVRRLAMSPAPQSPLANGLQPGRYVFGDSFGRANPNAVTYRLPEWSRNSITQLHGIFIQDQYTRGRRRCRARSAGIGPAATHRSKATACR